MICPVELIRDLSALEESGGTLEEVESTQQYSASEMERMMKLQDVLLKAMAKKITWWDGGRDHRGDGSDNAALAGATGDSTATRA